MDYWILDSGFWREIKTNWMVDDFFRKLGTYYYVQKCNFEDDKKKGNFFNLLVQSPIKVFVTRTTSGTTITSFIPMYGNLFYTIEFEMEEFRRLTWERYVHSANLKGCEAWLSYLYVTKKWHADHILEKWEIGFAMRALSPRIQLTTGFFSYVSCMCNDYSANSRVLSSTANVGKMWELRRNMCRQTRKEKTGPGTGEHKDIPYRVSIETKERQLSAIYNLRMYSRCDFNNSSDIVKQNLKVKWRKVKQDQEDVYEEDDVYFQVAFEWLLDATIVLYYGHLTLKHERKRKTWRSGEYPLKEEDEEVDEEVCNNDTDPAALFRTVTANLSAEDVAYKEFAEQYEESKRGAAATTTLASGQDSNPTSTPSIISLFKMSKEQVDTLSEEEGDKLGVLFDKLVKFSGIIGTQTYINNPNEEEYNKGLEMEELSEVEMKELRRAGEIEEGNNEDGGRNNGNIKAQDSASVHWDDAVYKNDRAEVEKVLDSFAASDGGAHAIVVLKMEIEAIKKTLKKDKYNEYFNEDKYDFHFESDNDNHDTIDPERLGFHITPDWKLKNSIKNKVQNRDPIQFHNGVKAHENNLMDRIKKGLTKLKAKRRKANKKKQTKGGDEEEDGEDGEEEEEKEENGPMTQAPENLDAGLEDDEEASATEAKEGEEEEKEQGNNDDDDDDDDDDGSNDEDEDEESDEEEIIAFEEIEDATIEETIKECKERAKELVVPFNASNFLTGKEIMDGGDEVETKWSEMYSEKEGISLDILRRHHEETAGHRLSLFSGFSGHRLSLFSDTSEVFHAPGKNYKDIYDHFGVSIPPGCNFDTAKREHAFVVVRGIPCRGTKRDECPSSSTSETMRFVRFRRPNARLKPDQWIPECLFCQLKRKRPYRMTSAAAKVTGEGGG